MLYMEGLSPAANAIIESFSSLEILKDYYLIGGTSLAIQINHRLSEDLDFCQWIPELNVKHAIPVKEIHEELEKKFGNVEKNQLSFHQVDFLVKEAMVKITFYQTDLKKPDFTPIPLVGNISMADLSVLGGSKMYVVTQRDALRDYYDLLILRREDRLTVQQMVEQARIISSKTTPELLRDVFNGFSFDGNRFKISDLDKLEPKYNVTPDDYLSFSEDVAKQIEELYPRIQERTKVKCSSRTADHLKLKIENGNKILTNLIANAQSKFKLTEAEIEIMISVGPYPSDFEIRGKSVNERNSIDLEERLNLQSGSIKNLIYNIKDRYSLSNEDLKKL